MMELLVIRKWDSNFPILTDVGKKITDLMLRKNIQGTEIFPGSIVEVDWILV